MLTRWDPFVDFARLSDDFFSFPFEQNGKAKPARAQGFSPAVDVAEEKDAIVVMAELPGLKADEVTIDLAKNVLTLKGERKIQKAEEATKYARVERTYGAFTRSFVLPETVDGEKIEASLADGVLTVRIPKRPSAQPRKIAVKTS